MVCTLFFIGWAAIGFINMVSMNVHLIRGRSATPDYQKPFVDQATVKEMLDKSAKTETFPSEYSLPSEPTKVLTIMVAFGTIELSHCMSAFQY